MWVELSDKVAATEFDGYDNDAIEGAKVVAIVRNGESVESAAAGEDVEVVLDRTPFYAEMGGQVADHGYITNGDAKLKVTQVKKTPKGYYVHTCVLESGIVKVGDVLTAQVDKGYRMAIARNHTAPICCRQLCVKCWATTSIRQAPIRMQRSLTSTLPTSALSLPRSWPACRRS